MTPTRRQTGYRQTEQGQQDAGNQPARRAEPGQSQQAQQHGQHIEAAVERGSGWLQMCALKDAVEHMAQHLHIRDQARIKADGGREFFAKTSGSGSNQHVFAAKSDRWDIAAQDVDIGVGGERRAQAVLAVPRSPGKSDELGLQLLPGVGCNRVCWRWGRWLAGLGGLAHAVQAQRHMPPELAGLAFLRIKASHHTVGIHRHLGVPQSSSLAGKAL